ncbi:aspartate/glutamate racemase family protein (plasmid) [Caballeronia sp. NK8]|uniref:aspartate/glutamate racemase family protein n=1 Tax=Caballeronia sp. NK8 TaxID=140098 RepID=UPI001BB5B571|nr:amino acid racemase [Caballeronia sp. NK8]BCQ28473.1 aspartate/glutamate racemase family protein [Caballeronia sp. NK8]
MNDAVTPLPRLGVLGGMGPLATADFLVKLIRATPAASDQEHMPVIVHNVPQVPDRSAAFLAGSDAPWPHLLDGLRTLEAAGCAAIAIPCNTAHVWHPRLAHETALPVLHIGEAGVDALLKQSAGARRGGILATSATLQARIYHDQLAMHGIAALTPDDALQGTHVSAAIGAVKGGHIEEARMLLAHAAQALIAQGADALLLACTEIPVALAGVSLDVPAIDPTDALARACVGWWLEARSEPAPFHTQL